MKRNSSSVRSARRGQPHGECSTDVRSRGLPGHTRGLGVPMEQCFDSNARPRSPKTLLCAGRGRIRGSGRGAPTAPGKQGETRSAGSFPGPIYNGAPALQHREARIAVQRLKHAFCEDNPMIHVIPPDDIRRRAKCPIWSRHVRSTTVMPSRNWAFLLPPCPAFFSVPFIRAAPRPLPTPYSCILPPSSLPPLLLHLPCTIPHPSSPSCCAPFSPLPSNPPRAPSLFPPPSLAPAPCRLPRPPSVVPRGNNFGAFGAEVHSG